MVLGRIEDRWPHIHQATVSPPRVSIDGNPHTWEAEVLCRVAVVSRAQTAFEIGTFNGATAIALGEIRAMRKVWTLDLPIGGRPAFSVGRDDWRYMDAAKLPFPTNVVQLWGDSATFDFSPYSAQCDLIFVMGAHSPEYIENDIEVAFRLHSENGVIVLHTGTPALMANIQSKYDVWTIGDRMALVSL